MPDQICLTQLSIALSDLWAVIRLLTWQASPDERVACHSLSVFLSLSLSPSSPSAAGKSAASCSKLSGSFCYYIAWVVPKVVKSQQTKRGATRRRRKNNRKYFALTDLKKCKYAESDAFSLSLCLPPCLSLSLSLSDSASPCLSLSVSHAATKSCDFLHSPYLFILPNFVTNNWRRKQKREREKDRHDCNERERASKRQAEGQ